MDGNKRGDLIIVINTIDLLHRIEVYEKLGRYTVVWWDGSIYGETDVELINSSEEMVKLVTQIIKENNGKVQVIDKFGLGLGL